MRITAIESRRENRGLFIGNGRTRLHTSQSDCPKAAPKTSLGEFLLLDAKATGGVLAIIRVIRNYQYSAMAFMYIACCFMA